MDKKLINEEIQNMKYLFGYKPGRVISEQDIDYTTDDYLDMEEIEEDIFDGWDDPDNFKSERIGKIDKLEDDEFEDLEDFGDFGIEDDKFEWLPDEDNNHRDEMM